MKKKKKGESHSVMSDSFATPWTVAHHAPLPVGFSRQEYWSGLPFLPPGDLLNPGMEPTSPMSPALQVDSEPSGKPISFILLVPVLGILLIQETITIFF